jgi:hypothetical protein
MNLIAHVDKRIELPMKVDISSFKFLRPMGKPPLVHDSTVEVNKASRLHHWVIGKLLKQAGMPSVIVVEEQDVVTSRYIKRKVTANRWPGYA